MPVDPTISLAAGGGIQAPAANPAQPLDTWAQTLNRINQNQLFQQTFAARQRAGQIMSAAPDLESGLGAMLKDPLVAPFAGAMVNEIRQSQKTLLDIHGETSKQAMTGLEGAIKALSAGYADPSMIGPMLKLHLQGLGPEARVVASPLFDSLGEALGSDLPPGEAGIAKLRARISGLMASSGMTDSVIRGVTGTMAPAVQTGPFGPGGAEIPYSVGGSYAPGLVGPGGSLPGAPALGTPNAAPAAAGGPAVAPGAGPSASPAAAPGGNALSPGSPGTGYAPNLLGLTPEQKRTQEESGQFAGTLAQEMANTARNLPEDLNRVNMMQRALGEFRAGGGAQFRSTAAQIMQGFKNAGLNISDDLINRVGNENLASTQIFASQVRPEVINQLKQAAQGTGRVMRSEVDAFLSMMSANIDPEALRQMLNQTKYRIAVDYDRTQKFANYKGDPLRFDSWYNNQFDPYSLPTRSSTGGLDFGPIKPEAVKGSGAHPMTLWRGWGEEAGIPRGSVEHLRSNPDTAEIFDQRYGSPGDPNPSRRFLSGQQDAR